MTTTQSWAAADVPLLTRLGELADQLNTQLDPLRKSFTRWWRTKADGGALLGATEADIQRAEDDLLQAFDAFVAGGGVESASEVRRLFAQTEPPRPAPDHTGATVDEKREQLALLMDSYPSPRSDARTFARALLNAVRPEGLAFQALVTTRSRIARTHKNLPSVAAIMEILIEEADLWSDRAGAFRFPLEAMAEAVREIATTRRLRAEREGGGGSDFPGHHAADRSRPFTRYAAGFEFGFGGGL